MAAVALLLLLCADPAVAPAPSKAPPPLPDPRQQWPPDSGPRPAWADVPGRNTRYDTRGFKSEKARKEKRGHKRAALEADALSVTWEALQSADMFSTMAADAAAAGWMPILETVVDAINADEADPWRHLNNAVLRQLIAAGLAARDTGGPASATAEGASTAAATAAAAAAAPAEGDMPAQVIEGM